MKYELIIEPTTGWLTINWRDLLHYRDLLWLLVRRDFVAKYKQTILGPLWFVIQPLLTAIVFTVIFNRVAGVSTDELPPMLFYLCGMLGWQYFADCISGTSATFFQNQAMFSKVYFPRLVVPLSVVISKLLSLAIQFGTFAGFWIYFNYFTAAGSEISGHLWKGVLLLPVVIQQAALGLAVGLWLSSLTAKYRDFMHLTAFLTQLWLYATPVVYPLSVIPDRWRWASVLNPMTQVVEIYRRLLLGQGTVTWQYVLISVAITAALLATGLVLFTRTEKNFIDTV